MQTGSFRRWVTRADAPNLRSVGDQRAGTTMIALALACFDLFVVALHLALPFASSELFELFDVNAEANFPAWYSSMKLLSIGTLAAFLAYRARSDVLPSRILLVIAASFVAMSIDEIAGLHERVGFVIDLVIRGRHDGAFHRTGLWFLLFGLPVAVALSLLLSKVSRLLNETPGTMARILIGLAVFFSGALVVEALSNVAVGDAAVILFGAPEEGLELVGQTIVLWAMLVCVAHHPSTATLVSGAFSARPPS